MFKVSVTPTYLTPVDVEIPDGTGKSDKRSFKARFRRLEQSELDEVYRRLDKARLLDGEEQLTDDQLLAEVLVGWEGVMDEDGEPLEFNEPNTKLFLNIYPVRPTTVVAFFNSTKTSKRKN